MKSVKDTWVLSDLLLPSTSWINQASKVTNYIQPNLHQLSHVVLLNLKAMTWTTEVVKANGTRPMSSLFDAMAKLARDGPVSHPQRVLPLALVLADAGRSPAFQSLRVANAGTSKADSSMLWSTSHADKSEEHHALVSIPPGNDCSTNTSASCYQEPSGGSANSKDDIVFTGNEQTDEGKGESQEAKEAEAIADVDGYLRALNALGSACTAISDAKTSAPLVIARAEVCLLDAARSLPLEALKEATSPVKVVEPSITALPAQAGVESNLGS